MKRSITLTILLALGIPLVGLISVFGAEASFSPDRSYETTPPLRLDSLYFRAQEAAFELFRQGCLQVTVGALPDPEGTVLVFAACVEWQEVLPASR